MGNDEEGFLYVQNEVSSAKFGGNLRKTICNNRLDGMSSSTNSLDWQRVSAPGNMELVYFILKYCLKLNN